jgi:hypothetical protein
VAEWWLIVRLESYSPAVFDDAMASQMAGELFSEWVQEETMRRIAQLSRLEATSATASPA